MGLVNLALNTFKSIMNIYFQFGPTNLMFPHEYKIYSWGMDAMNKHIPKILLAMNGNESKIDNHILKIRFINLGGTIILDIWGAYKGQSSADWDIKIIRYQKHVASGHISNSLSAPRPKFNTNFHQGGTGMDRIPGVLIYIKNVIYIMKYQLQVHQSSKDECIIYHLI